jgi:aldehyde dehydrogenase (NAD+)
MKTAAPEASLPNVKVKRTQLLIDGRFCDAVDGKTFATINPATEEKIADIAEGTAADIDLAVRSSRRAFAPGSAWRKMSARDRGRLLYRLADLVDTHADELAQLETLDNGKPITASRTGDIPGSAGVLRYYAGWADKICGQTIPIPGSYFTYTKREPVGVCGQIIPWNYPLMMASWKIAPALAAGCTVVLKPAEQTPLTALRLGELALEAGFPPGVLNVVPGFGPTAGAALVKHPQVDKIAFTGEHKTAQIIMRDAADTLKRLTFELGGKSPNIVFADSNLDEAVEGAYGAIFSNMGQNCCAGSRAFVQEKIYDEFVDRLAKRAQKRKLGNPFDPETEHGPQVDRAQFDKILHYIGLGKEQGARCATGGRRAFDRGFFVEPTVFADVKDTMAVATDEIFGPVVSVLRFRDLDEVVGRANQTFFGLAAAVWTKDIGNAHAIADRVQAGTVWVNCYNVVDTAAPFGGFKMSGIGRELGEKSLENYTETKTVTIHLPEGGR